MDRDLRASARSQRAVRRLPFALAFLIVIVAAAWSGCDAPRRERTRPVEANASRVDVFLGCTDPEARPVTLELASVELRAEDGRTAALELLRPRLVSKELAHRLPLAGGAVEPAQYSMLVLRVQRAELVGPDGVIALRLAARDAAPAPPGPPGPPDAESLTLELPIRARLGRHDALSLFVDWQVAASLTGGAELAPLFTVATERPRAALGLLYVADGASSSVLAVDRGTGEVVATFKSGADPRAIALARDRRRLYVANAGDGSLGLVDAQQGGALSTLTFGLSARSSDVALLDARGLLAVAQRDLDKVSIVDTATFTRVSDVSVGRMPTRLAAAPDLGRVFVVETGSDAVEVVDLAARAVAGRVATEARPSDAAVDRRARELFVGHAISANLLVFDARSLAPRASIWVGADVTAVLCDRRRDRVYVARSRPAELVVVDRELGSVLRRIPLSGRVEALAQPIDGAELYGAAPELGALVVIDLVLGRELAPIRCGGRPLDVLVAD
ncbi:MAG: hypothetical protein HZA53_04575 [Planctomycetes bacterium]|nr:hypothetical protein [Planctomycetota bacterium]